MRGRETLTVTESKGGNSNRGGVGDTLQEVVTTQNRTHLHRYLITEEEEEDSVVLPKDEGFSSGSVSRET